MTARPPHMNGGWPELPAVQPEIEELSENPTPSQILKALGSTLLMFGQLWPRTVQALNWLKGSVERIEQRLDAAPALPPMRAQLASSTDLAKAVGHDVAQAFEREQRNPSTPPPNGSTVAAMVEERVAHELLKIKAATLQREKDDRIAFEGEQQRMANETRRAKRRVLVAAITTGLVILGALVEHFAR